MHLIAFSFEAASEWKPHQSNKNTPRLSASALLLHRLARCSNRNTLSHITSVRCYFQEFPRLLAEREIIANAFLLARISPRTWCKGSVYFRDGKEEGQKNHGVVFFVTTKVFL